MDRYGPFSSFSGRAAPAPRPRALAVFFVFCRFLSFCLRVKHSRRRRLLRRRRRRGTGRQAPAAEGLVELLVRLAPPQVHLLGELRRDGVELLPQPGREGALQRLAAVVLGPLQVLDVPQPRAARRAVGQARGQELLRRGAGPDGLARRPRAGRLDRRDDAVVAAQRVRELAAPAPPHERLVRRLLPRVQVPQRVLREGRAPPGLGRRGRRRRAGERHALGLHPPPAALVAHDEHHLRVPAEGADGLEGPRERPPPPRNVVVALAVLEAPPHARRDLVHQEQQVRRRALDEVVGLAVRRVAGPHGHHKSQTIIKVQPAVRGQLPVARRPRPDEAVRLVDPEGQRGLRPHGQQRHGLQGARLRRQEEFGLPAVGRQALAVPQGAEPGVALAPVRPSTGVVAVARAAAAGAALRRVRRAAHGARRGAHPGAAAAPPAAAESAEP